MASNHMMTWEPGKVERVAASEWALLRRVRLAALLEDPDAFGATYDDELRQPQSFWLSRIQNSVWLFALEGESPVGVVAMVTPPAPRTGEHQLDAMWVAPARRGSGLSALLVEAVLDHARDAGSVAVSLTVAEGNLAARRLYARMGFRDTGERFPRRRAIGEFSRRMRILLNVSP